VRFDRRVNDHAYRVLAVIGDHLNEKTGRTILSDKTIAFEAGGSGSRTARRARNLLMETGWLKWHRTRTANIYEPDFSRVNATLATMAALKQQNRNKTAAFCDQIGQKRPRSKMAALDRPKLAAIHLRGTPSK